MKPNIPELLRQKRGEQTLAAVARATGISQPTLSRLEHGSKPSAEVLEKVYTWLELEAPTAPPVAWQVEEIARQVGIVENELTKLRRMIAVLLD